MRGRGSIKLAREKFAQASRKQVIFSFVIAGLSLLLLFIGLFFVWRFREDIDNIHYYNKHGEWRDTCQKVCSAKYDVPPLILISLDGFRADYLERNITPAIQRLINCGVSSPYMYPTFPASTFPNHYTIATGLYPESHGIVDNYMYDETMFNGTYIGENNGEKVFGNEYSFNKGMGEWYNGEPIWNTVANAGKKSGTFFWPGSEVVIKGMTPTYRAKFSNTTPFSHRVDTVGY
uniref:Uncharacterized protein n=1 Tax=Panagrolaimus sp. PS1159 TaxID=55785 RepID=A0AC35G4H9_9BILA